MLLINSNWTVEKRPTGVIKATLPVPSARSPIILDNTEAIEKANKEVYYDGEVYEVWDYGTESSFEKGEVYFYVMLVKKEGD